MMYSSYKGTRTAKLMLSILPNTHIAYLSVAFGGRTSDTMITNMSGFLDLDFCKGDIIMTDKGFPKIQVDDGVILVMPPISGPGQKQFPAEAMAMTKKIASVRIHVERVINKLRAFHILQNRYPLDLLPHIDKVVHVIGAMVNLSSPALKPR